MKHFDYTITQQATVKNNKIITTFIAITTGFITTQRVTLKTESTIHVYGKQDDSDYRFPLNN